MTRALYRAICVKGSLNSRQCWVNMKGAFNIKLCDKINYLCDAINAPVANMMGVIGMYTILRANAYIFIVHPQSALHRNIASRHSAI